MIIKKKNDYLEFQFLIGILSTKAGTANNKYDNLVEADARKTRGYNR